MGVVYKARQKSLDRLVALKLLAVPTDAGPDFAERFGREARALAALSHPSIVTVHDFGRVGERFFLLMEFVDGANLHTLIHDESIEPRQALGIVTQVCDALQFAHDSGVVHRDIKPENILVDRKGRVKIADFGLAKILGQEADELKLTGARQVMGTAHYMAPEQLEHPLEVDHRADLYSLGVVFYELLTGELPIGRFQPPSKKIAVDLRIDEVVLRSLEKEPQLRYQQASQIKTDVEVISDTLREPASAETASHARRGMPRWVLPAAIVTVVFAAAAFGLLAVMLLSGRSDHPILVWHEPEVSSPEGPGTALIEATARGYRAGVEVLLDSGVDVNASGPGGHRALIQAADSGHVEMVELLLVRGADPNAAGIAGNTAVLIASARGDFPIVEMLLLRGADPDAVGGGGTTALIEAADGGQREVAELLRAHGANVNAARGNGITALILAAARGDDPLSESLLAAGADVNASGPGGTTALLEATDGGHGTTAAMLLQAGADPSPSVLTRGGISVLGLAAARGDAEIVGLLLQAGADVNARGPQRDTPLILAFEEGNVEVARLLIDAGADVNAVGNRGQSPLTLAAGSGRQELLDLLK